MRTTIAVPALGNEITEGIIVEWLKSAGDTVELGETVVVIGTPKLNLEVEAPASGTLVERQGEVDDIVEVGTVLGTIQG